MAREIPSRLSFLDSGAVWRAHFPERAVQVLDVRLSNSFEAEVFNQPQDEMESSAHFT